ncbi:MAG: S-layer homology domain-containing protein [Oscillospiraceae bacterium]|nr:S-layer homology domain-containing protein [Oscillospiraceae bacterium]
MRKKQRVRIAAAFTAVIITAHMCFMSAPVQVAAQSARKISDFTDVVQSDWFYIYVKQLYEDGIINGVSENSYDPDADVKMSEAAALIVRYLGNGRLAEISRESKRRNNIEGAELWYSGYIQAMIDMGIFDDSDMERYKLRRADSGSAHISEEAAAVLDSPVKRADIIKFISKSFEIEWWRVNSNNLLKSDISGNGHEFITGGGYDRDILESIKSMISDYGDIPEDYRMFFLRCYYNGIVRGNAAGEVKPHDNLKRSELARIISSVMYFDMRNPDIRSLPALCAVTDGDYSVSSVDGSRILKKEKAETILREQSRFTRLSDAGTYVSVSVIQQNIIPQGFYLEAYLYAYVGGEVWPAGSVNAAANTHPYFPKENAFTIEKSGKSGGENVGYIYFVLRDMKRGGEVAGAVMFNITANAALRDAPVYYN